MIILFRSSLFSFLFFVIISVMFVFLAKFNSSFDFYIPSHCLSSIVMSYECVVSLFCSLSAAINTLWLEELLCRFLLCTKNRIELSLSDEAQISVCVCVCVRMCVCALLCVRKRRWENKNRRKNTGNKKNSDIKTTVKNKRRKYKRRKQMWMNVKYTKNYYHHEEEEEEEEEEKDKGE